MSLADFLASELMEQNQLLCSQLRLQSFLYISAQNGKINKPTRRRFGSSMVVYRPTYINRKPTSEANQQDLINTLFSLKSNFLTKEKHSLEK